MKYKSKFLVANARQFVEVKFGYVDRIEQIPSAGGPVQASQNIEQARFARATRAHKRYKFPAPNLQRDSDHSLNFNVARLISLGDSFQFNYRGHVFQALMLLHSTTKQRAHRTHTGVGAHHSHHDLLAFFQALEHFGGIGIANAGFDLHRSRLQLS